MGVALDPFGSRVYIHFMSDKDTYLRQRCTSIADECVGFGIRRAARAVGAIYDEVLAQAGLRGTQFNLLSAVAVMETASIQRLAEALVMDRTTLTRNLRPLEKDGLLQVVPGEDRRTRVVTLTRKGKRTLTEALPLWEQAQQRVVSQLGEGRSARLRKDLVHLVDHARGEQD